MAMEMKPVVKYLTKVWIVEKKKLLIFLAIYLHFSVKNGSFLVQGWHAKINELLWFSITIKFYTMAYYEIQ